jgi:predicted permease
MELRPGNSQLLESTLQDLRLALRSLRKRPGFAATAILTLTLGIGANTAIFQLLDAVRLKSLPVVSPQQLATIQVRGGTSAFGVGMGDPTTLTYALFEQIHKNQQSFSRVFAWSLTPVRVGEGSQQHRVQGLFVSGDTFATLGMVPFRGRLFTTDDDRPGCGVASVVLSYAFWQSRFGGTDSAIGSRLTVADYPAEVIGVTPPAFFGFQVGKRFDVAVLVCSAPEIFLDDYPLRRRDYFWLNVMGRLKPGWSLANASAHLQVISPGLIEASEPTHYGAPSLKLYRSFRLVAYPGGTGVSSLREQYDFSLWLLLGTTSLVLLIACANLANLMLARASTRQGEMAVRLALGATRAQLIRQLLSEGALLALFGGVFGVALASILSRSLVALLSTRYNLLQLNLGLDWRILAFTAGVSASTCAIFSLAPAFQSSRAQPIDALKTGARGSTLGRARFSFQRTLVVSQIAISLVLLVGASLFVRSFWNLTKVQPGFRQTGIVITTLNWLKLRLPLDRYVTFERDLLDQIRAIPQVDSAATATRVPLGGNWTSHVTVAGIEGSCKFTWVSPAYFQTLQIPFLSGRDFNDRDLSTSLPVAVVSETFVAKFLDAANPIGKLIRTASEPGFPEATYQIVGVVKDTKYQDLREEVTPPEAFAPASQYPYPAWWTFVAIRSSAPSAHIISAVRDTMAAAHPGLVADSEVLEASIQESLVRERMMALLSGFFGALAALLAMTGLYGIVSYIVEAHRKEFGIRMTLGASRTDILAGILRQTLQMLTIGVAVGLLLALAAAQGARALLFGLSPNDPLSLIAAPAFLAAVALAASYFPARRASRTDPISAIRYE